MSGMATKRCAGLSSVVSLKIKNISSTFSMSLMNQNIQNTNRKELLFL
jgi:hypothetical protein